MRPVYLFAFLVFSFVATAQKTVVLESWRWYDKNPLLVEYLSDRTVKQKLASDLNQALLRYQKLKLYDTSTVNIRLVDFGMIMPAIRPTFEDLDTNHLHLYINSIEIQPYYFFRNNGVSANDTAVLKRTKTIFHTIVTLFDYKGIPVFTENFSCIISEAPTAGIGFTEHIDYTNLFVLPGTFTSWQKTLFSKLFDPKNDIDAIEIKLQPAYVLDDYILPKTIRKPRVFVNENKGVFTFLLNDTTEWIRLTEPIYQQILLKGKNLPVYPRDVLALIKEQDDWAHSDFVWLKQDLRDVIRNTNLTLQLIIQVNPLAKVEEQNLLTGFLPGQVHYLLDNKDTVGRFSIRKDVANPDKHIFWSVLYNGYDSSQFYTRRDMKTGASSQVAWSNYEIEGSYLGKPLRIQCGGINNTLKEIYYDGQLVCVAEGKLKPEKFVLFDASLPNQTLNLLLLLSYNQFFP